MCIWLRGENIRSLRSKSSYVFLKRSPGDTCLRTPKVLWKNRWSNHWCRHIAWKDADLFLIGPLGTHLGDIFFLTKNVLENVICSNNLPFVHTFINCSCVNLRTSRVMKNYSISCVAIGYNSLPEILIYHIRSTCSKTKKALVLQGPDSIKKRCHVTGIGNPIVEIRRFYNHPISTMGFHILVRWCLYIESGPWVQR